MSWALVVAKMQCNHKNKILYHFCSSLNTTSALTTATPIRKIMESTKGFDEGSGFNGKINVFIALHFARRPHTLLHVTRPQLFCNVPFAFTIEQNIKVRLSSARPAL